MTLPYRLFRLALSVAYPVLGKKWTTRGLDHVPASGPVIFVCNHISYWDPTAILWKVPRQIQFLSKAEMFEIPVLGRIFEALGVVPLQWNVPDIAAMRRSIAILNEGGAIALFPQGSRRSLPEGRSHSPKSGAILLAERSGAPIVPVAVAGIETLFLPRPPWLGRPEVTLTFGRPFLLEELRHQPEIDGDRDKLLGAVMEKVTSLLPSHREPAAV